jgi:hypothetical protein
MCGLVVSYVSSSENYKQKSDTLNRQLQASKSNEDSLSKQLQEKNATLVSTETQLKGQLAQAQQQISALQTSVAGLEREKSQLADTVKQWADTVQTWTDSTQKNSQALADAQAKATTLEESDAKLRQQIAELNTALMEKLAIIDTMQNEKKRLVEEKSLIQAKLDNVLQASGKTVAVAPVTPPAGIAQPAPAITKDIALKGKVAGVDMQNSWASISIGAADGVKQGMRFHVVRGNEFICDILVIDVDTDKSLGVLELVQQPPRVGDVIATNL